MKKLLLILFAFAVLTSCKKDDLPYNNQYNDSYNDWSAYKSEIKNSYSYISYSGSIFGTSSETKIIVQNGVVTGREYTLYKSQGPNPPAVVTTWTEDQATLNTHPSGASAITLDEVYAKAKTEWLTVNKNDNDIVFETDSNGLITSCGYVPKGCMDDCFIGINIRSVTPL